MTPSADSVAHRRLEEFDALRVTRKLREYFAQGDPNQVTITLPTSSTAFGAFARVEIVLPDVTLTADDEVVLAEVGMAWPPSDPLAVERQPINVLDLSVERGGHPLHTAGVHTRESLSAIVAETASLREHRGPTRIRFSSPSLFFLIAEAYPFHKYALGFDLTIPGGGDRTVMYLDHGLDIGLRCRLDNSDYHSLAYSAGLDHIRKITFFERPTIRVRYQYGISGTTAITDVVRPLYAAGIGAVSAALTISLVRAGSEDLASATLALALLPPFAQAIRVASPFYPSADIARRRASRRFLLLAAVLYLPILAATAWLLTRDRAGEAWAHATTFEDVGYAVGGFAIVLSLLYALLVQQQTIPRHYCDNCATWLVGKWQRRLHTESRKTLCPKCMERNEVMRLETEADRAP